MIEKNKHKLRSIEESKYVFMPSLRPHFKFRQTRTPKKLLPDCVYQKLTPHHVSASFQRSQSRCELLNKQPSQFHGSSVSSAPCVRFEEQLKRQHNSMCSNYPSMLTAQ